jgi:hypothetical protein
MSSWRCPHCRVAQPETSRCWVCQRSTTSCDTCRHYRRAVAPGLGFCGLDRRRVPLLGDEMRACWEAAAGLAAGEDPDALVVRPRLTVAPLARRPALEFVEVAPEAGSDGRGGVAVLERAEEPAPPMAEPRAAVAAPLAPLSSGWTLWGDTFL